MFREELGLSPNIVSVDIVVSHRTSETAGLVSICSLERAPGQRGVGIFTPERWRFPTHPTVEFSIIVNFPSGLHLKSFETNLPRFAHHMDNLVGKVSFDELTLQTTNSHMNIEAADAITTAARTTNGHIVGNFTTFKELSLTTTNGLIAANVEMHNTDPRIATKVVMKTSNGPLTSKVNLLTNSTNHKGGAFRIKATTTNDPLTIAFPVSPSSAHLSFEGMTTNAPATVNLNARYEGAFHLQTSASSSMFVHYKDSTDDPDGLGRDRVVDVKRRLRGVLEGTMTWGWNQEAKGWSDVDVKTTNGPVSLAVV